MPLAVEVRRRWAAECPVCKRVGLVLSFLWTFTVFTSVDAGVLPGPGLSTSVDKLEKLPES